MRNLEETAERTVGRASWAAAAARGAMAVRVVAVMAAEARAMVVKAAAAMGREKGTLEAAVARAAAARVVAKVGVATVAVSTVAAAKVVVEMEAAAKEVKVAGTAYYRSTRRNGTLTQWRREPPFPSISAPHSSCL